MSDESIKPPSTTNNILNPLLDYVGTKARVEFKGSCLKQDKISFDHGKVVNVCIVYEINKKFRDRQLSNTTILAIILWDFLMFY